MVLVAQLLGTATLMLSLLLALPAFAARLADESNPYYPDDFYQQVENGLSGQELKDRLFEVLSKGHQHQSGRHDTLVNSCGGKHDCAQHVNLGYDGARRALFGRIHLEQVDGHYAIKDLYCNRMMTDRDFGSRGGVGPDKIPNPNILNVEHTWPQSHFTGKFDKTMQKSDLHHLFPVFNHANSVRGSFKFGDVVTANDVPCPDSKRGYTAGGGRENFFEPPASHKGNVARAIFYFATRYQAKVTPDEESALRSWSRLDPVDDAERARNEAVYGIEKVRNPFVDHPELVDLISDF